MTEAGPVPLPARSVLLSVLLGSHPPRLPVRTLVRTAELFGITEGTTRVALSRLTADGEVEGDGGSYGLSPRHLERQRDQDSALRPATRAWRGGWVLAMPVWRRETGRVGQDAGRESAGPADLRRALERERMAELAPGVWGRPDNLASRLAGRPPPPGVILWNGQPALDGTGQAALAAQLWDLPGWAAGAAELLDALDRAEEPADRLNVAAAMVRHIRADPVLPAALLPDGGRSWPGRRLRRAYDAYRVELGRLIATLRDE